MLTVLLSLPEIKDVLASNSDLAEALDFSNAETFDFGLFSAIRNYKKGEEGAITRLHFDENFYGQGAKTHETIDYSQLLALLTELSSQNMAQIRQMLGVVIVEGNGV